MTDAELLRRFSAEGDESAFAALVRRHVDLVYFAALRQTGGSSGLAQDVTQDVFSALARKARALAGRDTLAGWLYTSTRFAARKAVRSETRRRVRERESQIMEDSQRTDGATADWTRVRPAIDEALRALGDADREAVLLRFFEGRAWADVGAALRLSEEAARKRVERALARMADVLARRGITSTGAALGAALTGQSGAAAPAGVAAACVRAGLAARGVSAWFPLHLAIGSAAAGVLIFGLLIAGQVRANRSLRDEIAAHAVGDSQLDSARKERARLMAAVAEVDLFRRDSAELERLRAELASLRPAVTAPGEAAFGEASLVGKIAVAGRYRIPAQGLSVAELLRLAGGVAADGRGQAVRITRTEQDGRLRLFTVDAVKAADFIVKSGDRVYVPEK